VPSFTLCPPDVTIDMVPKLVDAEWKELIPQVGIRTALRKAAADLHTEGVNDLETEIETLRQQKAELQKEEDQQQTVADRYKEQIDLAKSRLKSKTQEMLDSQSQVSIRLCHAAQPSLCR
jgi:ABC-type phosphate transport system auxiliary subunit